MAWLLGELLGVLQNLDHCLPCGLVLAHQSPCGVLWSVSELRRVPWLRRSPLWLVCAPQHVSTAGQLPPASPSPGNSLRPRLLLYHHSPTVWPLPSLPLFSYSSFYVSFVNLCILCKCILCKSYLPSFVYLIFTFFCLSFVNLISLLLFWLPFKLSTSHKNIWKCQHGNDEGSGYGNHPGSLRTEGLEGDLWTFLVAIWL